MLLKPEDAAHPRQGAGLPLSETGRQVADADHGG